MHDEYEDRSREEDDIDPDNLHWYIEIYHGAEPRRYMIPQHIPPGRVSLYEHVPRWNVDENTWERGAGDEIPQPWAQIPFTERPIPGHEAKTVKVSAHILYHVAPPWHEQDITQHGIDHTRHGENLWDDYAYDIDLPERGSSDWPEGNYLFDNPEAAAIHKKQMDMMTGADREDDPDAEGEPFHLWQVDPQGLSLQSDPQLHGSVYTPDPIPPTRIKRIANTSAHNLLYDRDQHPEGKGFILNDGSVWTWPTENLKPMHMQYNMKVKRQGLNVIPGSAFHIKEGKVWQYGPGRSLTPEQHQIIYAADPSLEPAPTNRQEELDSTPGYGHGENVLNILEHASSWNFQSAVNIPEVAQRVYENVHDGEGITINLHGEPPRTRYGFAPDVSTQTPYDIATFTPQDAIDFIHHFQDRLADPEKFVGAWVQGDQAILDVSEGHDDFDTAFQRAWNGHQKSLWDNEINDEIPVRGLDYEQPTLLREHNG